MDRPSSTSPSIPPPRAWLAWLLGVFAATLLLGCSKDSSSYYPGEYQDNGYAGGYDSVEEDYAELEASADYGAAAGALGSRGRAKQAAMYERREDFEAGEAPPAPPAEPSAANQPDPELSEPVIEPVDPPTQAPPATNKRQIIYTATMQVRVFDVDHAVAVAEALPERLGGWLHQRTDTLLVLRVPAERLAEAMGVIAELGVVEQRLLEALDVTAQYTDLSSRIRTLEHMQAQLQALLAKAKDVEQALEIRKALDAVTLELELARAQMRELSKSIAFSTLVIQLVEAGPDQPIPSTNDPFGWVDELGVEATEYR